MRTLPGWKSSAAALDGGTGTCLNESFGGKRPVYERAAIADELW